MKHAFKPLGVAAAVAAASAGYVNVASAQSVSANDLGDLALVPYYTVNGEWVTGIHIVNTSDKTQVVKFRFRRATDSMDALDFNVIMSPQDVYAGVLTDDENGNISWSADDTTCTAPATTAGALTMPSIYRADAETGYVEIIGMGEIGVTSPIGVASKHSGTTFEPLNCEAVRSNFFADGVAGTTRGVIDNATTWQSSYMVGTTTVPAAQNDFDPSSNALKVSYFIRDNDSGVEFGDNAVHIEDFLGVASITNQQYGYFSGDLDGFDFPDLNGGVPLSAFAPRGAFNALRAAGVLGKTSIINEWSANPANGVEMDWVVTLPGQYTMFDLPQYVGGLDAAANRPWIPTLGANGAPATNASCPRAPIAGPPAVDECDYRDMPVVLTFTAYNREEFRGTSPQGDLVVSPAPPGEIVTAYLPKEANVVTFGGNSVLGQVDADVTADLGQPFGWVTASIASVDSDIRVCDWDLDQDNGAGFPSASAGAALDVQCTSGLNTGIPVIGFAAWARSVAANPDASYGRIIEHSYTS
ncbi:MAG: hypothetical protein AAGG55_14695 [Pseudomonadota bacterium]